MPEGVIGKGRKELEIAEQNNLKPVAMDTDSNVAREELEMVPAKCCVCTDAGSNRIAKGEDFEYRTSDDTFSVDQCDSCGLVYLNPRPDISEFGRIYPDSYHAFEFSEEEFGLVYKVRRRLEAKRLLSWCAGVPDDARILDVGCGDGFHLDLLKEFGKVNWRTVGVDMDKTAVAICEQKGLDVHCGTLSDSGFEPGSFDFAFTIQTVEHVADPAGFLSEIFELLKPGGKLVVVTDNTGSLDFSLFKKRYWGGYHFPRHWNLFDKTSITMLGKNAGFETAKIATQVSPVNWTYSIRNFLVDKNAPRWIYEMFSLRSTLSLSFFTAFDMIFQLFGNGALLNAHLTRPTAESKRSDA